LRTVWLKWICSLVLVACASLCVGKHVNHKLWGALDKEALVHNSRNIWLCKANLNVEQHENAWLLWFQSFLSWQLHIEFLTYWPWSCSSCSYWRINSGCHLWPHSINCCRVLMLSFHASDWKFVQGLKSLNLVSCPSASFYFLKKEFPVILMIENGAMFVWLICGRHKTK
jgi:hypothetical protein